MTTADKILQELGYEQYTSYENTKVYYKRERGKEIEIRETEDGNIRMTFDGEPLWATPDEILACAQLVRERREQGEEC